MSAGASHIGPMNNEPANYPAALAVGRIRPTTTLLLYRIPGLHDL